MKGLELNQDKTFKLTKKGKHSWKNGQKQDRIRYPPKWMIIV